MLKNYKQPSWLWKLIGIDQPEENQILKIRGMSFKIINSIPRFMQDNSENQQQTSDIFGYKWKKRDTFEDNISDHLSVWLDKKYGKINKDFLKKFENKPFILDAGCGAGLSGMSYFKSILNEVNYLGVDISNAVDTARLRFFEKKINAGFIQCDLSRLPFLKNTFDVIFSEGVLHHTDNTYDALESLSQYLKVNGKIFFYVYKKKSPIREFSDDFIREKVQDLSPDETWEKLIPLTKLGELLGKLNIEIDIKEKIDLLEIPSGKIDLQRLFYWHIFKAFYKPEMNIEEMNHINFDWYAPKNAFRQTPEEVRLWCENLNLNIEHEYIDEAGITIIAKKIQ